MKTRYRFSHASDDGETLHWEATKPIDSRTEIIWCRRSWFWAAPWEDTP